MPNMGRFALADFRDNRKQLWFFNDLADILGITAVKSKAEQPFRRFVGQNNAIHFVRHQNRILNTFNYFLDIAFATAHQLNLQTQTLVFLLNTRKLIMRFGEKASNRQCQFFQNRFPKVCRNN